jgi:hypothetical protein
MIQVISIFELEIEYELWTRIRYYLVYWVLR